MNKIITFSIVAGLGLGWAQADSYRDQYWEKCGWNESIQPVLSTPPSSGMQGRVMPDLEWVTPTNVMVEPLSTTWQAKAWRNERVHGQFVIWSDLPREQVRATVSALKSAAGDEIAASNLTTRFVRYTPADGFNRAAPWGYGDCLDTVAEISLPTNGFRPLWLTVKVPFATKKGLYRGALKLAAADGSQVTFPLELAVSERALPQARPSFVLDLWQLPWSVARYHDVELYSPLHYELLRPLYRELAAAGQRPITTFIVDDLWPGVRGKGDTGNSMVGYTIYPNGRRDFDFTIFDRHVEFAKSCGLGPDIHCYSLVRFQQDRKEVQDATYFDGESGFKRRAVFHGFDDPKWAEYWGPLVAALEQHAKSKGWQNQVYIGIDEMNTQVVASVKKLLAQYAPTLKLQFANDKPYADFAGFGIDNFSQALRKNFMSEDLFADLPRRRSAGKTTTFYVCAGHPMMPNNWLSRPTAESEWIGLYAAAKGFDGFMRWAAFTWPRAPFLQSDYHNCPGETTFLYPGCRASVRWERLRDAIESYEKICILRKEGTLSPALTQALNAMKFAPKLPASTYSESVKAVNQALNDYE